MLPPRDLRIIEKDGIGTLYHWKGKKWSIFVSAHKYGRYREQLMLRNSIDLYKYVPVLEMERKARKSFGPLENTESS